MNDASQRSSVVVIGGGYAGITLASALDDHTHVTLVEPKDAFVHDVAALRALVEPTWVPPNLPAIRPPPDDAAALSDPPSQTDHYLAADVHR